jgi:hypothetical protein
MVSAPPRISESKLAELELKEANEKYDMIAQKKAT